MMEKNNKIKEVEAKIINSVDRQGLGPIRKSLREEPFEGTTKVSPEEYYKKMKEYYGKAIEEVIKNPPPPSDFFVVLDHEGRYVYWAVDEFFKAKGIETPPTLFLKTGPLMDALENTLLTVLMENPKSNLLKNLKTRLFDPAEAKGVSPYDAVWSHMHKPAKDLEFGVAWWRWGDSINVKYTVGEKTVIALTKSIKEDGNKKLSELFPKELYDLPELIQKNLGGPYRLEEDEISFLIQSNRGCFDLSPNRSLKQLYDELKGYDNFEYSFSPNDLEAIFTLEARKRGHQNAKFKTSDYGDWREILNCFSTYPETQGLMQEKLWSLIGENSKEFFDSLKAMIKEKGKVNVTLTDASICSGTQLEATELFLHILFGEKAIKCERYVPTRHYDAQQFFGVDYGNFQTQYLTYKGMEKDAPLRLTWDGVRPRDDSETHEKVVRSVFRDIISGKK